MFNGAIYKGLYGKIFNTKISDPLSGLVIPISSRRFKLLIALRNTLGDFRDLH